MNRKIETSNAPKAIGSYSQAVQSGSFLFLSGVMPVDPVSNQLVEGDFAKQATQVIQNIDSILKAAGYDVDDVVKTTCFLSDINNFAIFNEVYGSYFTSKPARSCIAARDLPKGALVEVEVIANKTN